MNYFDLFVLIVLGFAVIRGLQKGFIFELASLLALVLGIVGAVFLSGVTAQWLSNYITSKYISIIAFVFLLVGIIILVFLIAKMIDTMIKALALGWLNRIMGAMLAVVKAAFGISLVIFVLEFSGFGNRIIPPETRSSSRAFSTLEWIAPATFDLLRLNYQHLLPHIEEPNQSDTPVIV
jgi:membrane protein required for colicin V production